MGLLTLSNRIDFCGIIIAERCNPNGDPVNGNVPRQDFDGYGIISDVCIKRKIRNELFSNGYDIFVVTSNALPEGQKSLHGRARANPDMEKALKSKDVRQYRKSACEKWMDVRAFGQVFAFKQADGGLSEAVRGPVSIQDAVSLDTVTIQPKNITKSVNTNDSDNKSGKASDTFGVRYIINCGAYVFRGSMHPQLAELTGFTYGDALAIRDAMCTMFRNDISAARPSGSMSLDKLYWWEHNCPNGQYPPAKVFRSLSLEPIKGYPYYTAVINGLPGLKVEVFDGW